MTKVDHNGYKGYSSQYKGTSYVVWNGSYNSSAAWYVTITDTPHNFSERDTADAHVSRSNAVDMLKYLVDKKIR